MSEPLAISLPPETLEAIAQRVAELLAERQASENGTDGWVRGARAIAEHIGSPRSRVYALAACKPPRIPIEHDGQALVARRCDLDAWLVNGGGKRP